MFFGKNQGRKAETGNRARRARTQDRKGGEAPRPLLEGEKGEGEDEGGKKVDKMKPRGGQNGTKVDKMARKWIKWQGSDMWHGDCNI